MTRLLATIEERAGMIESAILEYAHQKSNDIQTQTENFKKEHLEVAENQILQEMYNKIQDQVAEIKGNATKTVAKQEAQLRQQLLMRREEITNNVFRSATKKLLDFTKTPEYETYLLNIAKKLSTEYPLEDSIITVKSDDYSMSVKLDKIFSGKCKIIVDDNIKIGGIKLMNQTIGIFVDETMDTKLNDRKPWFYSNSGLTIN